MPSLWRSDHPPSAMPPRHHSTASQDSQRSGIAASAISFGGESLRLSQFPNPPAEIPTTPLQSEFGPPTPTRNHFTLSDIPPATPKRSRQINVPLVPQIPSAAAISRSKIPPSTATSSGLASLKSSPQGSSSTHILSQHPLHFGNPNRTLSPSRRYDWNEAASTIDMDPAEDRLLSTAFITSLLSSTEPGDDTRAYSPISFRTGTLPPASDGLSRISDMSYPPSSSRLTGSPSSGHPLLPPQGVRPLPALGQPQNRGPPPSSFPALINATIKPASRPHSSDSMTLHSGMGHEPASLIGNVSVSRGNRVSGATVVGAASTKPRTTCDDENEPYKTQYLAGLQEKQDPETLIDHPHRANSDSSHVDPSSMMFSPALPSTIDGHACFRRESHRQRLGQGTRQSQYSTKTTKSYAASLISRVSAVASAHSAYLKNALNWRNTKPLPPIPTLPHLSVAAEAERRKREEGLPMPQLVNRADTLAKMLEKGDYPHDRLDPAHQEKLGTESFDVVDGLDRRASYPVNSLHQTARDNKPRRRRFFTNQIFSPSQRGYKRSLTNMTTRTVIGISLLVVFLVVIAIAVAVTVGKKRKSSHLYNCPGNLTGALCNLDATCVCTTSLPGQCGNLANGLISLIPTVNTLFQMNLTKASLSTAIWTAQGQPIGGNCAPQVLLVDVSPALDPNTMPNRTQWARSALLWNLVQSQDLAAANRMRSFISSAPWNLLGAADGPVPDTPSKFQISVSGFIFDFASQTVTQPNVTFISNGNPTSQQVAQVGSTAQGALDKMYSYALASSSQRQSAWATYWRTTLQQQPEQLPVFMSTIASSPILIPFNASIFDSGLLTNSTNAPFPPPLGCYPSLNSDQIQRLNTIETEVFGLPPIPNIPVKSFNTTCFPGRPLYGVLDILQLRLPFVDSRTDVARQAAVLKRDVGSRAVVYSGEILSALPNASDIPDIGVPQTDPRQYGTLNNFNHVILNYITSISDVNVARALVNFVLSSTTVPPANTSQALLFQSLSSLPILEVAVFGTIDSSDISSSVSSFATSSGSLFFGSDEAAALRSWAITEAGSSVVWTEFVSSPLVVRDSSFTDSNFNSVWDPAFAYLHSDNPGVTVGISNITNAFQAVGKFSP